MIPTVILEHLGCFSDAINPLKLHSFSPLFDFEDTP
jgi:hypothetical protein